MVAIIILIILLILSALIVPFTRQLVKDKIELKETPINKKFELLVSIINDTMLGGLGEITLFENNPRMMNLMSESQRNMLIQFYYSTGNLTIILNYKYFQKELVHKELYSNVRNITIFRQKDIANSFIEIAFRKIREHQERTGMEDVNNMSQLSTDIDDGSDPMNVVREAYSGLSLEQKRSIINLLYIIAKYGGLKDDEITKLPSVTQQLLTLELKWNDCVIQYQNTKEEGVVCNLKGIEEGLMTMIILSVMQLMNELKSMPHNLNADIESYAYSLFNKIGYSEKRMDEMLKKMMLMQQMFGL